MSIEMTLTSKNKFVQFFCKHVFAEVQTDEPHIKHFFMIDQDTDVSICVKCGKIRRTQAIRRKEKSYE